MTFIIVMKLLLPALAVVLWSAPAQALAPLTTDDTSTLDANRTQLELTSTVGELQLTAQTGLSDQLALGVSFGVLEHAFARDPGIQVKWRLLEPSATEAVALRLGRAPAGGSACSASEALVLLSRRYGRSSMHVNIGAMCSDSLGAWSSYSSVMLATPAHDQALLAVELGVEGQPWGSPRAVGKAALVEPLSDVTTLSLDIAPEYSEDQRFAVSGTLALTLGLDVNVAH